MKIDQLRKDDFYLPILITLDGLGGSASNEEMQARIVEGGGFSDADMSATYPKSGALILPDKISWGRSYLKQAGLILNEKKGLWIITEKGRNALAAGEAAVFDNVAMAMREYHKNYQAKKSQVDITSYRPSDLQLGEPVKWWPLMVRSPASQIAVD